MPRTQISIDRSSRRFHLFLGLSIMLTRRNDQARVARCQSSLSLLCRSTGLEPSTPIERTDGRFCQFMRACDSRDFSGHKTINLEIAIDGYRARDVRGPQRDERATLASDRDALSTRLRNRSLNTVAAERTNLSAPFAMGNSKTRAINY